MPDASICPEFESQYLGSSTGMLTRNSELHQKHSSIMRPTSRPAVTATATATETLMTQALIASLRLNESMNILRISKSVDGASGALATQSSGHVAISISALIENATSLNTAQKAATAISRNLRRLCASQACPWRQASRQS